ncbi:BrnA antitoxin family protein [Labrys sp. (in: a-proteobacteria)]|uniref:BrnA antitoxin family protein n=1 Tax=Labrys sp. (in: a-proteobacteria) TaxID=1917972 RepID=UPI0039E467BA
MAGRKASDYIPNSVFTREDWSEVSDNPTWKKADFAKARPAGEVLPTEMMDALKKRYRGQRGRQRAPTKMLVSLRLDQDIIDRFKADGPGWQSRINEALRKALAA